MPTRGEWGAAIAGAPAWGVAASGVTFLKGWPTDSRPVALTCDDGRDYIVKALQPAKPYMGRVMVTEHVVGRAGAVMGAPVGEVGFIDVPAELIAAEPSMAHMLAGRAHGSVRVVGVSERAGFEYVHEPANRDRYARLMVLYSWIGAADHQFIFENSAPHRVYSVDHGHFLPGGHGWSSASLAGTPAAIVDPTFGTCALTAAEIAVAANTLEAITVGDVAHVCAGPPEAWGMSAEERIDLADYLWRRREELLLQLPH